MPFSVVLIARNESQTLPRLLLSLAEFRQRGGEVIVVDTGSSDDTIKVAHDSGCNVFSVGDLFATLVTYDLAEHINSKYVLVNEEPLLKGGERIFKFDEARNFAAALAKNDMIAMPDCDEIYTVLDLDRIESEIEAGADQFRYNFVFSHRADGSRELEFVHSKFYRRTKLKWTGVIHEVLTQKEAIKDVKLGEDVILLEHFQNPTTDRRCYLAGLALDVHLHPDNDRNTHYFARELYYYGRYRSAIALFERHIAMNGWKPEQARSVMLMGDCYQFVGEIDKALDAWHRSFTLYATREPLIRLADHYYKQKDYARVASYTEAALAIPREKFYFVKDSLFGTYPHELLYWAYYWMGEKDKARDHWEACLTVDPHNERFQGDRQFFS